MAQVIDASVAIAWCAADQATPLTRKALISAIEHGGEVPPVFWFEVVYGLEKLMRRKTLRQNEVDEFVILLSSLSLTIHQAYSGLQMMDLWILARLYGINIYDAAYLELAIRRTLPLATRDTTLAKAAKQAGAVLLMD